MAEKKKRGGSLRCSLCGIEWPDDDAYKLCPDCEGETWWNRHGVPIAVAPARNIVEIRDDDARLVAFRNWLEHGSPTNPGAPVTAADFETTLPPPRSQ